MRGKDTLASLEWGFGQRAPAKIADIVDEHVDPSETAHNRAEKLVGARRLADVGFHSDAIHSAGLQLQQRPLRGGFIRTVRARHTRAVLRQPHPDSAPEPAAATGT